MGRRAWIRLAALSGLVSVAAGAFAAHGIADPLSKELLRTGAQYQAVHALATLACIAILPLGSRQANWAMGLFMVGSLLFCGSLYALALGAPRLLGAVTPLGGLSFLAGWASLAWAAARLPPDTMV